MRQPLRRSATLFALLAMLAGVLAIPGGVAARAPDAGYRINLYRAGAFVSDPFYPRTSSTWGRSAGPNVWLTPSQLSEDFHPGSVAATTRAWTAGSCS